MGNSTQMGSGVATTARTTGSALKSNPTRKIELGNDRCAMRAVPTPTLLSLGCCNSSTRVRVGTERICRQ